MTPSEVKSAIDAQIRQQTADNSVTQAIVAGNMDNIVNLTPLEYCAPLFQQDTGDPIPQSERINTIDKGQNGDLDYRLVTFERNNTGNYVAKLTYAPGALSPSKVAIMFGSGYAKVTAIGNGSAGGNSYTQFVFSTYTPEGVVSDGILNGFSFVSIKIYP